jgi:molybdopterin-guanine dinucleotide biosynthesis adapter protein
MGRVIQVVGYQNSGKTTFVVEYIQVADKRGLKVGTIKHHGHQGSVKIDDYKKDSGLHRHAGAQVSVVEGNGSFVMTSEKMSLTLKQLVFMYRLFQLDIVVIEGYKSADYPKVVLIRSIEDLSILYSLENICCVITSIELPIDITKKYKIFNNTKDSIEWLLTNKVGELIE